MSEDIDPSFSLDLGDGYRLRLADPQMIAAFARIQRTAASRMPFLITGETGVGKELAARAVHHHSGREGPLVCINCGGIPDSILESELFGFEQGAFTGAHTSRSGLFDVAKKGTLFLDEIGDLPMRSQAALLRVLDGHSIMRLGGRTPITFDTRIVAATNREMESAVESGRFRADLYHRLLGLHLHIPPLRERPADVRLLAHHHLQEARDEQSLDRVPISDEAMRQILSYAWPGNVRQLKHAMTLAAVRCGGNRLELADLPDALRASTRSPAAECTATPVAARPGFFELGYSLADELRALERKRILEALSAAAGVQVRAARMLGMPRRTLVRKLKQHRLEDPERDTLTH